MGAIFGPESLACFPYPPSAGASVTGIPGPGFPGGFHGEISGGIPRPGFRGGFPGEKQRPILNLISQPYLPTLSPKPYLQTISPNLRRPTSSPNLRSRTTGTNLVSQPHHPTPSPNLVAEPHRRTLSPDLGPRTLAATLCGLLCGRGPWTPTAAPLCAGASMDALSIHQLRHRSVRALPWTRSLFPN